MSLPKELKSPQRTCVACRKKENPKNLIRIYRTKEKKVKIQESDKNQGRGLYFCREEKCLEKGFNPKKIKFLNHTLKVELNKEEWETTKEKLLSNL